MSQGITLLPKQRMVWDSPEENVYKINKEKQYIGSKKLI